MSHFKENLKTVHLSMKGCLSFQVCLPMEKHNFNFNFRALQFFKTICISIFEYFLSYYTVDIHVCTMPGSLVVYFFVSAFFLCISLHHLYRVKKNGFSVHV